MINFVRLKLQLTILVIVVSLAGCARPKPEKPASEANEKIRLDKENAFELVKEIVAIGARPSGSRNALKTANYILAKSEEYGYTARLEAWSEATPVGRITFRNVYADLEGHGDQFVILGSHYDTKRLESISSFAGANDSGSSTAVLLEIMRTLKKSENWAGPPIKFAFFDGEEAIRGYSANDGLHGSRKMARDLKQAGDHTRCRAMILIDMVGDADLTITIPPDDDSELTRLLFAVAVKQQTRTHFGFFPH